MSVFTERTRIRLQSICEARMTYKKAQQALMDELKSRHWALTSATPYGVPLKIPYITSPRGDMRLWFKKQAIYYTEAPRGDHSFKNARSLHWDDFRSTPAKELADRLE